MIVTKPKVVMRLFWESKDTSYDKCDRERYSKIRRVTNKMSKEVFKKIILKNKSYDFYRGFCFSQEIKECLNETEYEILLAVIDNIKTGYYDGGKMAKKFIGKENGNYIIDKKVRKDKKLGIITWVTYITCEGIKPKGAIKFFENEKEWLEKDNPNIEWEEVDG